MANNPSIKNSISTVLAKVGGVFKGVFSFVRQKIKGVNFSKTTLEDFCDYANNPYNFATAKQLAKIRMESTGLVKQGVFDENQYDMLGNTVPAFDGDKNNDEEVLTFVNEHLVEKMLSCDSEVAKRTAEFLTSQTKTIAKLIEKEEKDVKLVELLGGNIEAGMLMHAVKRLEFLQANIHEIANPTTMVKAIELQTALKREAKDARIRSAQLREVENAMEQYNQCIESLVSNSTIYKTLSLNNENLLIRDDILDSDISICQDIITTQASLSKLSNIWMETPWLNNVNCDNTQPFIQNALNALAEAKTHAFYDKKNGRLIADPTFEVPSPFMFADLIASQNKHFILFKNNIKNAAEFSSYKPYEADDATGDEEMGFMLLTRSQVAFLDKQFKQCVQAGTFNGNGAKNFTDAAISTKFSFLKQILEQVKNIDWSNQVEVNAAEKAFIGITQFHADDEVVTHIMKQEFRENFATALALRTITETKKLLEKDKSANLTKIKKNQAQIENAQYQFANAQSMACALQQEIATKVENVTSFEEDELDYFGKRTALDKNQKGRTLDYHTQEIADKNVEEVSINTDETILRGLHEAISENTFKPYNTCADFVIATNEKLANLNSRRIWENLADDVYTRELDEILTKLETKFTSKDPLLEKLKAHIKTMQTLVEVENHYIKLAQEHAQETTENIEEEPLEDAWD